MEYGQGSVAAQTLIFHPLVGQQMPVWRPVGIVTGGAAFNADSAVLKQKWSLFIGVALEAGRLLEAAEPTPGLWLMRIVTGHAAEQVLVQPVAFIKREFCGHNAVALGTEL